VGFEDLTEVNTKSSPSILWDVIPCRLADVYQNFGRTYCSYLRRRISHSSCCLLPACSAHSSTLMIGGSTFSRNVCKLLPDYTASNSRIQGRQTEWGRQLYCEHQYVKNILKGVNWFGSVARGRIGNLFSWTANCLQKFGWEVLRQAPYSPDLAPSHYSLPEPLKKKKFCEPSITGQDGGVYNRATLQRYLPCLCDYELELAIATGERIDFTGKSLSLARYLFSWFFEWWINFRYSSWCWLASLYSDLLRNMFNTVSIHAVVSPLWTIVCKTICSLNKCSTGVVCNICCNLPRSYCRLPHRFL
jgi:hypothetical protein